MHALVIGYGISGRSASKLLLQKGWQVTAMDRNAQAIAPELGVNLVSEDNLADISLFNLAVLSPGIPSTNILVQKLLAQGIEVVGEIELAFRWLQQPVIGITGTNGKTTVTLLVAHVLDHSGIKARALGNVGVPLAAEVDKLGAHDVVVAELSSYQLETLKRPLIDAGVILNITPDHLDRYGSMEKYAAAKYQLRNCLKLHGKLFVEERTYQEFKYLFDQDICYRYGYDRALAFSTDLKSVFKQGMRVCELPQTLQGKPGHDVENFLAAYALCDTQGVTSQLFLRAYETFKKPHHRIEFVKTLSGIHFYDDSKGTNIDAVIRAVESMQGKTILIAGGVDKGAAYTPWIAAFGAKVKSIYAIGQAAGKIQNDLQEALSVHLCMDLNSAVQQAYAEASPGDNILLSPGCSSFDMFRDYVDRGEQFQASVHRLKPN